MIYWIGIPLGVIALLIVAYIISECLGDGQQSRLI
jgi:hypothetical protein